MSTGRLASTRAPSTYVPFADAIPSASTGWLETPDPDPGFEIQWTSRSQEQASWLRETHAVELVEPITQVLSLGPRPHPYRRIRRRGTGFCLAVKDWRVLFRVEGRLVTVESIGTGYRARDLAILPDSAVGIHRAFISRFGER